MAERRICFGLRGLEFFDTALEVWHEKCFSRLDYTHDKFLSALLGAEYFYSQRSTITIHKTTTTSEIFVEVNH